MSRINFALVKGAVSEWRHKFSMRKALDVVWERRHGLAAFHEDNLLASSEVRFGCLQRIRLVFAEKEVIPIL